MASIEISDLSPQNETLLVPLGDEAGDLIQSAIARALEVRGGLNPQPLPPGSTARIVLPISTTIGIIYRPGPIFQNTVAL